MVKIVAGSKDFVDLAGIYGEGEQSPSERGCKGAKLPISPKYRLRTVETYKVKIL